MRLSKRMLEVLLDTEKHGYMYPGAHTHRALLNRGLIDSRPGMPWLTEQACMFLDGYRAGLRAARSES